MIRPLWTAMMRCKRSMRHLVQYESTSVPGLISLVVMYARTHEFSMLESDARQHLEGRHDLSGRFDLICTDERTSGVPIRSLFASASVGTKRISVLISTDRWLNARAISSPRLFCWRKPRISLATTR